MKLAVFSSLIISVIHSILFYEANLGVSVVLFAIVVIFAFIGILEKQKKVKNKKAFIISIPIILLSSTYFIYSNIIFYIINIIVIILLFALMLIIALTDQVNLNTIISKIFFMIFGPIEYLGKATKEIGKQLLKTESKGSEEDSKIEKVKRKKVIKQILIGGAIAIPILIIVLSLLMSADILLKEGFEKVSYFILSKISISSIISLICRIILIIALSIYLIAFILNLIKKDSLFNEQEIQETSNYKINLEGITINTVITLLNILYLIFTLTQSIYLTQQIAEVGNLNYAEYARTGFFQLMIVSVINFAIIFVTNLNKSKVSRANQIYTKIMNIVLALFTIIILVISMLRMSLYEQAYGYTFLRLMVYFVQITELILIIPTIAYIINKKIRIIKSYAIIVVCAYVAINFVNIDKIIAKRNIDRYLQAEDISKVEIDYYYLQNNLSIDALPEMTRLLNVDDERIKTSIKNYLNRIKEQLESKESKWQEYNISVERAKEELKNKKFIQQK